jgi:hypothetical protein
MTPPLDARGSTMPARAPQWLADAICKPQAKSGQADRASSGSEIRHLRSVGGREGYIADKLAYLAGMPQGGDGKCEGRAQCLNETAFACARVPGLDRQRLRQQLHEACDANGWRGEEGHAAVDKKIDRAFNDADFKGPYQDDPDWNGAGDTDFGYGMLGETDDNRQPTNAAEAAREHLANAIRDRALQIRIDRAAKALVDAEQRPKIGYPPVRSLTALLAQPCPPTRWRIEQVAPIEARVIAAAQFKAGKTTMRDNAVRSLVDREPFLGRFAIHNPASALVLIDDELSDHMVQDWLGRQNIRNTDAVADVITLRGKVSTFNLFDDTCRAAWSKRFRDLGCDYLILDCLRPILDTFGLDENRDAGLFLVKFDEMLEAAGIRDAMLVHHMGHQGERSRGDSRLLDWPDVNWRLIRENEGPSSARYFSAYGRDVAVPEGRLTFNEATRHLTYVDGSRGDAKTEVALQAVITVLVADARAGGEGLSGRAIEFAVSDEHTQKSIRNAVKLAGHRELVVKAHGSRNATLHRIARPCSACGYPLTAGQGPRHESCEQGAA